MNGKLFPDDLPGLTPHPAPEAAEQPSVQGNADAPLAERMRPRTLDEVVGQDELLAEGRVLRRWIRQDSLPSLILWGPPGVGKTTIARLIARETRSHFVALSAVLSGVRDVKRVVEEAQAIRRHSSRRTILFVDEIHRFNKAQQDAFLPHVENGTLILIGATTENPSFEVIGPLLSRCRVMVLKPLGEEHILGIVQRALSDAEHGLGKLGIQADEGVARHLAVYADGDARRALNGLEAAAMLVSSLPPDERRIDLETLKEALQHRTILYDKGGEEHFNLISALHKSLRNSDADASLYWLARMLESGEDPRYILRRLIRFASEDVGLADPAALGYAVDAWQAYDRIGLPEGKLALAQIVAYLARAPKSDAIYRGYGEAAKDVAETRNDPVPLHLRNAPTGLMKNLGYGRGYRSAHREGGRVEEMDCLPESLKGRKYLKDEER